MDKIQLLKYGWLNGWIWTIGLLFPKNLKETGVFVCKRVIEQAGWEGGMVVK